MVHVKTLVACLLKAGKKEVRTFSTRTEDLLRLRDWLTQEACTHVAIESTGVYWRPVFNILEGTLDVILTNARDAKRYKARKTDVIDAKWLADLLRHGLLKPSFIPPLPIRELRDLTRYREQTAWANRIQRLSESANIKLGQVASDALGASGQLMLRALAAGETDAEQMSHLAPGILKRKQPQVQQALAGRFTQAQRWVLTELLAQYDHVEASLQRVAERIRQEVETSADPFVADAVPLLDTIPGVGETVAQIIVAEIGGDRERFPTDHHPASWAGIGPGNHESAGKRKSG